MPITERLMKVGQWSLKLSPETPKAIRDLAQDFGQVYLFDALVRVGLGDATMLALARWGGVVRRQPTPWELGGGGMISWLGDEDGKGPIIEAPGVTGAGSTFAAFLGSFFPTWCPAISLGTSTAVAGTSSSFYEWLTVRQALDQLCADFNAEYRVNKDFTLDTAPVGSSAIYKQTPTAVALKRSSGRDLNLTGIPVTQLDVSVDAEEYITRALVKDTTGAWTGATGAATPYRDGKGNLLKMTKSFIESTTTNANAAALAANLVTAQEVLRNAVMLATDEFDITRDVGVGDNIWVYDQDSNMVDTTNQVRYRGSVIFPIKLRVLATTWPIERGMAVWYRDKAGVWTDLTNYVVWEQPGATFEVGAASRALLTTP